MEGRRRRRRRPKTTEEGVMRRRTGLRFISGLLTCAVSLAACATVGKVPAESRPGGETKETTGGHGAPESGMEEGADDGFLDPMDEGIGDRLSFAFRFGATIYVQLAELQGEDRVGSAEEPIRTRMLQDTRVVAIAADLPEREARSGSGHEPGTPMEIYRGEDMVCTGTLGAPVVVGMIVPGLTVKSDLEEKGITRVGDIGEATQQEWFRESEQYVMAPVSGCDPDRVTAVLGPAGPTGWYNLDVLWARLGREEAPDLVEFEPIDTPGARELLRRTRAVAEWDTSTEWVRAECRVHGNEYCLENASVSYASDSSPWREDVPDPDLDLDAGWYQVTLQIGELFSCEVPGERVSMLWYVRGDEVELIEREMGADFELFGDMDGSGRIQLLGRGSAWGEFYAILVYQEVKWDEGPFTIEFIGSDSSGGPACKDCYCRDLELLNLFK